MYVVNPHFVDLCRVGVKPVEGTETAGGRALSRIGRVVVGLAGTQLRAGDGRDVRHTDAIRARVVVEHSLDAKANRPLHGKRDRVGLSVGCRVRDTVGVETPIFGACPTIGEDVEHLWMCHVVASRCEGTGCCACRVFNEAKGIDVQRTTVAVDHFDDVNVIFGAITTDGIRAVGAVGQR